MNPRLKLILTGVIAFIAGGALVFLIARHAKAGGDNDEKAAGATTEVKHGAQGETIIVLDSETQKRIGLAVTNLPVTEWQPEVIGFGHVVDPATLASAIGDLETAKTAAEASSREYERLKTLADQNNVSAKNLEAAKAAATHDQLAYETARGKFVTAWGKRLSENPAETLKALTDGDLALFRVDLPAGKTSGSPRGARILSINSDEVFKNAEFFDQGVGIDPDTQTQHLLFKGDHSRLTPGGAVEAFISIDGAATPGVEVPADAVLRHQGKAWIYLQTGDSEFTRLEISDFSAGGGWFARGLAETNRVVVSGSQAVMSAELSGGGFNTGERD